MPNQFLFLLWKSLTWFFKEIGMWNLDNVLAWLWNNTAYTVFSAFMFFAVHLFFFSVLLLLAIMLMQYLCTWGLHIITASLNQNYLSEKTRIFCLFFIVKWCIFLVSQHKNNFSYVSQGTLYTALDFLFFQWTWCR